MRTIAAHALLCMAAIVFSTTISLGYTLGIATILVYLSHRYFSRNLNDPLPDAFESGLFESRYQNVFSFYDLLEQRGLYDFILVATFISFILFFVSWPAILFARRATVRLAPIRLFGALPETRSEVRALWRTELRSSNRLTRWGVYFAFALGFIGALLGYAETICIYRVREYFADRLYVQWLIENTSSPLPPPPRAQSVSASFLIFGTVDIIWVLGGTTLLAAGWVIFPARHRLARSTALAERWCLNCGHDMRGLSIDTCPECGGLKRASTSPAIRFTNARSKVFSRASGRYWAAGSILCIISCIGTQVVFLLAMVLRHEPLSSLKLPLPRISYWIRQQTAPGTDTQDRIAEIHYVENRASVLTTFGVDEANIYNVYTSDSPHYTTLTAMPAS